MLQIQVTEDFQDAFAALTGDYSSLHMNPGFARQTQFRGPISHGMLSVLMFLGRGCYEAGLVRSRRLRYMKCRFLGPARIGDQLGFRFDDKSGAFEIFRVADDVLVTTGQVEFAPRAKSALGRTSSGAMVAIPLDELGLLGADLEGREDTILFTPATAAVRSLLRLLDDSLGSPQELAGFDDANFCAALMTSTLVGMRLPGRYATFTEFDATFEEELADGSEAAIRGVVAGLSRSREQISLDLTWLQSGRTMGRGGASTLARGINTSGLTSAQIRANHQGMGLDGRVALVTGASRGIGRATAMLLASQGVAVGVHYFRGAEDASAIVDDIREAGGRALAVGADLSDLGSIESMFTQIEHALGQVDILVNNAVGDFTPKPSSQLTRDDYIREFDVTLFGAHTCVMRALPHMRSQRWGKIVNLGTIATAMPMPSQNKYIVSKSALLGYTRSLAVELAADNVQVNMVLPSMTETSLIASLPSALIGRLAAERPGGRLLQPIDVAKTIVFLASDWSSSISGQQVVLSQGEGPFL